MGPCSALELRLPVRLTNLRHPQTRESLADSQKDQPVSVGLVRHGEL
jgi:hypothetical protein